MSDLKQAQKLAAKCRTTIYCDEWQSRLSDALKTVDTELSNVEQQRDELQAALERIVSESESNCNTCGFSHKSGDSWPCHSCNGSKYWEPNSLTKIAIDAIAKAKQTNQPQGNKP